MCQRESNEYFRMNFKRNFKNELLRTIATLLQDICEENDFSNFQNDDLIKPFIGKIENMSVEDFLQRCLYYSNAESSTFIIMLIYIDRLCEINGFIINSFNVYKIIFSSLLIAIKYHEDGLINNKIYAEIFGIKIQELNILENYFCKIINYRLFIDDDIFITYYNNLTSSIEICIGC
jgi:hypothetical protein